MYQEKKLKLIISSLREKQLIQFFQLYIECFAQELRKTIKKISFNCYETTIQHRQIIVNGYGKNYNEAFASGISNFMEKALIDEKYHSGLRDCIRRFTAPAPDPPAEKLKTQPDAHDRRGPPRAAENALRPKDNLIKSVKTIKEEIFESLNRISGVKVDENIQLRHPATRQPTLNKNNSYSLLSNPALPRNDELEQINKRIKEVQEQIAVANQQNEYLRSKLREKQRYSEASAPQALLDRRLQDLRTQQNDNYLKDVSTKFNNTAITNQIKQEPQGKMRSYSLSNSINSSNFNSRVPNKVKIPKLNLQILPNYHGKSNKSLNQSLLQSYEKKLKGSAFNG